MNNGCRKAIFTIGHSNRSLEDFVGLLEANKIELLADVRTVPKSRTNPQFNQDTLPQSLEQASIRYVHFSELGGWRRSTFENSPNTGWRTPAFKNYADYMISEQFQAGIQRLISAAARLCTAIMCAEAVPWRCHRTLISDALTVRGLHVMHIVSKTKVYEHSLPPWAEVAGVSITYPASRNAGSGTI
jgi:uncharacterized protein (DUF488 family)